MLLEFYVLFNMKTPTEDNKIPDTSYKISFLISSIAAFMAGLCCFSPVILVLFGLGSVSFAGSLADTLYGGYKWYFRLTGFALICISYFIWYKKKSAACSLSQKKRLQTKMLNLFLISTIAFIMIYIVWLYVVVEWFGIQLGIWEVPAIFQNY